MRRISRDDLDYCGKQNECLDCYSADKVKVAAGFQTRGKFYVPCCLPHFNAHKSEISKANADKYTRRSKARREARQCVSPGCHNKLIPQELLPPWIQEDTCGMHGALKAFSMNRTAILRFIIERCLTDEERKGTPQSIIYKRRVGIVWYAAQHPGYYHTKGFSARDLVQRYKQVRQS